MQGNVDKVIEALKPLAEKLGEGAEFLYGVFYRQTLVEGILQLVLPLILMIVVLVVCLKLIKPAQKGYRARAAVIEAERKRKGYCFDDNGWVGAFIGLGAAMILAISISIPIMVKGALKVGNPHYYTIQRIIDSVKTKELQ